MAVFKLIFTALVLMMMMISLVLSQNGHCKPNDTWMEDCNYCSCTLDGLPICTLIIIRASALNNKYVSFKIFDTDNDRYWEVNFIAFCHKILGSSGRGRFVKAAVTARFYYYLPYLVAHGWK
ncbi:Pacifastin inhibitor (LCMII) [Popillia japonica]|uniref:Pacifastin inhibitor (LCMII) n=1 Tax=Popillia japonica TaxID=7064 RepID=A0AAW1I910_POPJA